MASTAYADLVLETLFRSGGSVYLGISTTDATEDGTGFTEVTGGSYARVAYPADGTGFTAAADKVIYTLQDATFAAPGTEVGTVKCYAWFTASSGGLLMTASPLSPAVDWHSANPLTLLAGAPIYGS